MILIYKLYEVFLRSQLFLKTIDNALPLAILCGIHTVFLFIFCLKAVFVKLFKYVIAHFCSAGTTYLKILPKILVTIGCSPPTIC